MTKPEAEKAVTEKTPLLHRRVGKNYLGKLVGTAGDDGMFLFAGAWGSEHIKVKLKPEEVDFIRV